MKKKWPLLLLPMALTYFLREAPKPVARPVVIQQKKYPSVRQVLPRRPAALVPAKKLIFPPARDLRVSLGEKPIKIGTSFFLVEDARAVSTEEFKDSLGEKIWEHNGLTFFTPNSRASSDASFVAQNVSTKKLYPIASVLLVKGVTEEIRGELKALGHSEYYFHPALNYAFLQTSPSSVLQVYQDLTKRGYDAQLEVLKDPHLAH